jgi:hypothetical protein
MQKGRIWQNQNVAVVSELALLMGVCSARPMLVVPCDKNSHQHDWCTAVRCEKMHSKGFSLRRRQLAIVGPIHVLFLHLFLSPSRLFFHLPLSLEGVVLDPLCQNKSLCYPAGLEPAELNSLDLLCHRYAEVTSEQNKFTVKLCRSHFFL